jgi:hypothetical protein
MAYDVTVALIVSKNDNIWIAGSDKELQQLLVSTV